MSVWAVEPTEERVFDVEVVVLEVETCGLGGNKYMIAQILGPRRRMLC
jgi:hypothetical protein